jgi:glycosyltransferase involved in cell wall biosynthesis
MRIVCIIPTMRPGGAERSMSYLVAHLAKRHAVTLLTFDKGDKASFYPIPPSVEVLRTDRFGGHGVQRVSQIFSRAKLIHQTVKTLTPDVVVTFMVGINVTALVSCLGLGVPIVVSERIDPSAHDIGWAKKFARACTYPLARLIVVQTRRVASYFPLSLQPKIRIIGNAVPVAPIVAQPCMANGCGRQRVIAVGRCDPQKGFDRLIEAFAIIAGHYPNWDVVIVGDGPDRTGLEGRVRQLGLEERINLIGIVSDVYQELAASHVMAFPSRNEGFPNALAEGLAAGLPAVGYKRVSGVEDLIIDGETGLLVDQKEEIAELARALSTLMANANLRVRLGKAALQHVGQWAPDRMFALWDEVLKEAVAGPAKMAPVRIQS